MIKRKRMASDAERASLNILYEKLLEALRHREQEIFRYIVLVAPAIGGLVWLSMFGSSMPVKWLVASGIGLQLLAGLGAWYSLALGYNYRYVLAELRALEEALGIEPFIVKPWIATTDRSGWCWPPEVIKVFWCAFVLLIVVAGVAAWLVVPIMVVAVPVGLSGSTLLALTAGIIPWWYGRKLKKYRRG